MTFELITKEDPNYLEVLFLGMIKPGEAPAAMPDIFRKSRELNVKSIMFNMTNAVLNESLQDSFDVISNFTNYGLNTSIQLAIVFTQDVVQMHFLQTFAAIRKIENVKFFRSKNNAVKWLEACVVNS